MVGPKILVVSPRADLLGSLVFSLEAEGYAVEGWVSLPPVEWMRSQQFDACVVDQKAIDRHDFDAIGFCIRAHPVILIADNPKPLLHEWVSQVVMMPDTGEGLTTALRLVLASGAGEAPVN